MRVQMAAAAHAATHARTGEKSAPAQDDFKAALHNASRSGRPDSGYTVREGDVLSRVVLQHMRAQGDAPGNARLYRAVMDVARHNGLANPDYIVPGQRLDLSVLEKPAAQTEAPVATAQEKKVDREALTSSTKPSAPEPPPAPTPARASRPAAAASLNPRDQATDLVPSRGRRPASRTTHPRAMSMPHPGYHGAPGVRSAAHSEPSARAPVPGLGGPAFARTAKVSLRSPDEVGPPPGTVNAPGDGPWAHLLEAPARLTSSFGRRTDPFTGEPDFHRGIDLAAPTGTRIRAFRPGVVTFSGWQPGYGKTVIIEHADGLESVYGHNAANLVKRGQRVGPDTVVGLVGSTGRSTGPHLHFEVRENGRAVDPRPFLDADPLRVARR